MLLKPSFFGFPILLVALGLCPLPAVDGTWESLPGKAQQFVERVIAINTVLEPELDSATVRSDFAELVAQVDTALGDHRDEPHATVAILGRELLGDRQVGYLSNRYWRDSSFVAALQRRRGNCLATSTLYVAVGRALDLPIYAVFIPDHAFVCWSDGAQRINIETTAGGRAVDRQRYLARFAFDGQETDYWQWMQPMEDEWLIAELQVIAAWHLAGQGRYGAADELMRLALAAMPDRLDLELQRLEWAADASGERTILRQRARSMAGDAGAPRPAVLSALLVLADEYAAELDRPNERSALMRAHALAPWHQHDEILQRLSSCLRGLRDHSGAVLCMELAVGRDPVDPYKRAWLAGMLSEAGRMNEALARIESARSDNPEDVWMATMHAGILVLAGRREEGRALFDSLEPPRTGLEHFESNRAWFFAVWGERDEFYPQLEKALSLATDPAVLSWIAEDNDLDPYRDEPRFVALVEACRQRLLGEDRP